MKTVSRRNSSIELLKVLAVLLIIFSSAAPYGATYAGKGGVFIDLRLPTPTIQYAFFLACRWCGQIGDTLFITCSAWFLCESKSYRNEKILLIIIASWVFSMAGLLIAFPFVSPSIREIIYSIFPITFKRNWFVGCYILYYAIHPFINKAIEDISSSTLSHISLIITILYSVLSQFNPLFYFNDLIAFITIHILVTYCKKYRNDGLNDSLKNKLVILCFGFILVWIVGITLFGSKVSFLQQRGLQFCHYYNPTIIIASLCIVSLYAKQVWYSSIINRLSSYSLLIYLSHSNYFWLSYGKYYYYGWMVAHGIPILVSWVILVLIYAFISILLAEVFNHTVAKAVPVFYLKMSNITSHNK